MESSLTPPEFAYHLPRYYVRYAKAEHFSTWVTLEKKLTKKAAEVGYLNLSDLVQIAKWGGKASLCQAKSKPSLHLQPKGKHPQLSTEWVFLFSF
jgi:hypothetical protein